MTRPTDERTRALALAPGRSRRRREPSLSSPCPHDVEPVGWGASLLSWPGTSGGPKKQSPRGVRQKVRTLRGRILGHSGAALSPALLWLSGVQPRGGPGVDRDRGPWRRRGEAVDERRVAGGDACDNTDARTDAPYLSFHLFAMQRLILHAAQIHRGSVWISTEGGEHTGDHSVTYVWT